MERFFYSALKIVFNSLNIVICSGFDFFDFLSGRGIKVFVNMLSFASLDVKKDKYFLSLLIVFFIESFIWDPNNTPVFWIVVLFCPFYKAYLSAFKMDFK